MACFKLQNWSQVEYIFKFKLRKTIFFDWYKKSREKWLVKKSKLVWRKKPHPEHPKYSVFFSLEKSEQQNGSYHDKVLNASTAF